MSEVLRTTFGFVFLRASGKALNGMDWRHLTVGVTCVVMVGAVQPWGEINFGLGTDFGLSYLLRTLFVALLFHALGSPLLDDEPRPIAVFTCVCMTTFPSILLALPFELIVGSAGAGELAYGTYFLVLFWRYFLFVTILVRIGKTDSASAFVMPMLFVYSIHCSSFLLCGEDFWDWDRSSSVYDQVFRSGEVATYLAVFFMPVLFILYIITVALTDYGRKISDSNEPPINTDEHR